MGTMSNVVGAVSRFLDAIFYVFCTYFYGCKSVSHISNPLLLQSACSIAKKLRSGEISSSDVVNAYIERIREVDAQIHVVVHEFFSDALREAEQVDAELSRLRSGDAEAANRELDAIFASKPFYGVPLSIKSTFAVRGAPWHVGLLSRLHVRAEYDANEVKRLRDAGFIILCTTSVPEMAMWMETVSMVRSRSLNPYNGSRCIGGSSGGEGALVAAGGSMLGLGSDVGGSIRLPAAYCGVFGHKPTSDNGTHFCDPVSIAENGQRRNGHFPSMPTYRMMSMLAYGPLSRYAEDLWPALLTLLSKEDRERVTAKGTVSPASIDWSRTKFLYFRSICEDTKDGPTAANFYMNAPDRLASDALDRVIDFVRNELHADIEPLRFVGEEFASVRLLEVMEIWQAYMYLPDKIDPEDGDTRNRSQKAIQASWRTFDGKPWLDYAVVPATHSNYQAPYRISIFVEVMKKLLFWPLTLLGIDHPFTSRISMPILFSALNEKVFLKRPHQSHAAILRSGETFARAFAELFAAHKRAGFKHVVILSPSIPNVAPYHGKLVACSPFDAAYTALYNVLGLPCSIAPVLKDRSTRTNLPATVQIASDKFDDAACIAFAQLLESTFGGWRQPSEA